MVDMERDPAAIHFSKFFGRTIHQMADVETVTQGDADCSHERIFYMNNSFDGQAY